MKFIHTKLLLAFLVLATACFGAPATNSTAKVEVISREADEGLKAIVEAAMLKMLDVNITRKNPTFRVVLTCYWKESAPGTTSFYSSWGNADLTVKIERLEDESTLFAESLTKGGKSRGDAMKSAAEEMAGKIVKAGVFPKKKRK